MSVVRVLLVDDQAPFLGAMRAVVEETAGFEVVGEACSGEGSRSTLRLSCSQTSC